MSYLCRKNFLSSFSLIVYLCGFLVIFHHWIPNPIIKTGPLFLIGQKFFFLASDQKPIKSTPGSANVSPRMGSPVFLRGF